jgi:hypothetical protein
MISASSRPGPAFVLMFLLFSAMFLYNTYKLWFRTDRYYEDLRESLGRSPSIYPFRNFFLRQMEDRPRWETWQKAFSVLGLIAVLTADALMISAWLSGQL